MEYLKWILIYARLQEQPMAVIENGPPSECESNYEAQIKQIREITGADSNEAWHALKGGSFDVQKAIQILLNPTEKKEQQAKEQLRVKSVSNKTTPKLKDRNNIIDLTDEKAKDDQDIEKAIALSLCDVQDENLLKEQRDISRAVEASFNESKLGIKRIRTADFWHSVVETNPHEKKRCKTYPVGLRNVGNTCWFSAAVQSLFHIPAFRRNILDFSRPHEDSEKNDKKVMIVEELQKLFAYMIASRKKYIDPSNVIQCLTEFFTEDLNQQDVSEFMIKLIDCLEGAFKPAYDPATENTKPLNPVVEMFYGQYTVEGMSAGKRFTKEETFGAYPLQIENYGNLHECIERAMLQNNIECDEEQSSGKTYTQELWFTRLPAVLILELSRFRFNQDSKQPEKIHNKLEFEEHMFMDCYMQNNRDLVRELRQEIENLTAKTAGESSEELPATDDGTVEPMDISESDESPPVNKPSLNMMYSFKDLPTKVHYRLHAVLVHEGEANGGHYWAFIYDSHDQLWRKYNDIAVSDVTWEDVCLGSIGGSLRSSAYCLIYTECEKSSELFDNDNCNITEKLKNLVDEDNTGFEEEIKAWDKKQLSTVEQEKDVGTLSQHDAESNMETENVEASQEDMGYSPHKKTHRLNDSTKILNDVTNMVSNALNKTNLPSALQSWCNKERDKLQKRADEDDSCTNQDVRLEHKAIYMMRCQAPLRAINRAILERFVEETVNKPDQKETYNICEEARKRLQEDDHTGQPNEYKTWSEHYTTFKKANLSFLNGLDLCCDHKFQEALSYVTYAVKLNTTLPVNGLANRLILNKVLALCLWKISEKVFPMFTTGSDVEVNEAVEIMTFYVIPFMNMCNYFEVMARIRDKWLTPCLEKPRQGQLHEPMEGFLHYLCEGNMTNSISEPPLLNCELKTLCKKYSKIMRRFNNSSLVVELTDIK